MGPIAVWSVLALPYLAVPPWKPTTSRWRPGGFRSGEGGHLGVVLCRARPSADTTLTPVFFTDGRVRLDTELRLALPSLNATGLPARIPWARWQDRRRTRPDRRPETHRRLSLISTGRRRSTGRGGAGPDRLHPRPQPPRLTGAWGHSFAELAVLQDQVLMAPEDEGSWLSGWDESPATRAGWICARRPCRGRTPSPRRTGTGMAGTDGTGQQRSGPLITNSGLVLAQSCRPARWQKPSAAVCRHGWAGRCAPPFPSPGRVRTTSPA